MKSEREPTAAGGAGGLARFAAPPRAGFPADPAPGSRHAGGKRPKARSPRAGVGADDAVLARPRVSITTRLRALADRPLIEFPSYVQIMKQVGLNDDEIGSLTVGDCLAHMLIIQAIKGKNVRVTDVIDRIDGPPS